LPLIRSANTGISAIVDAHGRVVSGLDFGQQGFVDAILGSATFSRADNGFRHTYFWLIIAGMGLMALISRLGFISRVN
jgi:apolipoprotein N-acyltransferase